MKSKSSSRIKPPKKTARHADSSPELTNGIHSASVGIMTLAETAAFLRTKEDDLEKMAAAGKIPAREVGGEWRFLKSAICNWLSQPEPRPKLSQRERIVATFGSMSDDETALPMLQAIYEERRRHPVSELQD